MTSTTTAMRMMTTTKMKSEGACRGDFQGRIEVWLMDISQKDGCLHAIMTKTERALLYTAVEQMWYRQPVKDSAGKELKAMWTQLMEDLDKVQP